MTPTPTTPMTLSTPTLPSRYCYALVHPTVAPPSAVGHKAHNLMLLAGAGLTVPPGFVIARAAFIDFLARGGLGARIDTALATLNWQDLAAVQAQSQRIATWVMAAPLPPGLWPQVRLRCREAMSAAGWAVRSSAVGEDSHAASFAGQLDSYLHVHGEAALKRALKQVWASYWSARSLHYQRGRELRLAGMGVIFQHMVQPVVSGVAFTQAPVGGGGADDMLVEYCAGTGEKLVGGHITPARLRLNRCSGAVIYAAALGHDLPSAPNALPDPLHDPGVVRRVWEGARTVERLMQAPQDIEWVLDEAHCWHVVQARPIARASGVAPSFAPALARKPQVAWSNANVQENYPTPISPLLYSIARRSYEHYFRHIACALGVRRGRVQAMEPALRSIIGAHAGRMYYNLSSLHTVLGTVPLGAVWVRYFNQFVGAHDAGCSATAHRFSRLGDVIELGAMAAHGARLLMQMPRRVRAFEKRIDAYVRACDTTLATADATALLQLWRGFETLRNARWLDASLADAAAMLSYGALKSSLAGHAPAGAEGLHNTLLKGSSDVVSSEPTFALWELARTIRADAALRALFAEADAKKIWQRLQDDASFAPMAQQTRAYLQRWGFRCSGELMLTVPGLDERPWVLIDLLKAYVWHDTPSPKERIARQGRQGDVALAALRRHLRRRPWRYHGIAALARLSQSAVGWRERVRLQQARLYHALRRVALQVGAHFVQRGWLSDAEAVFFMRFDEIDAQLAGLAMLPHHNRQEIDARRVAWDAATRRVPASTFALPLGDYLETSADGDGNATAAAVATGSVVGAQAHAHAVTGMGACGGHAAGRAAVLHQVTDAARLLQADILVTGQTDPGWAPIFPLIQGLVIERGGMLSHGAIVAREFGIPAVVDVRDATTRIAHGSRLSLDGDTGRVQWTEAAP